MRHKGCCAGSERTYNRVSRVDIEYCSTGTSQCADFTPILYPIGPVFMVGFEISSTPPDDPFYYTIFLMTKSPTQSNLNKHVARQKEPTLSHTLRFVGFTSTSHMRGCHKQTRAERFMILRFNKLSIFLGTSTEWNSIFGRLLEFCLPNID